MDNKNKPYNKARHDSTELVYMYGKICNMSPNTFIGKYKVLEYLGKGGFGIVYKCYDTILKAEVAIKFLDPIITRDSKKFHRIKREINISRKITDDRIVKIYTMEKYYDVIFLVMEFIDGTPLSEIIKTKDYEWNEFEPILIQILNGLKLLHEKDIIHRDVKPGNIMIQKNGNIKIVDFGLAKEISDNEKTSATEEFSGTAEFVSPEQVEGSMLDVRSDIYQVGLVIFKVLSGHHPLNSSSTMELLVKYITVNPQKISKYKKNLPEYARFITDKMLERKKNNRFNNIDEILHVLEKKNVTISTQLSTITKKNSLKSILIAFIIFITAIIVFFTTYGSKTFNSIEKQNNKIIAKNKFNKILWEKDFTPNIINKAFLTPVNADLPNNKNSIIICLLKNENIKLNINSSIISTESDSKVILMKTDGSIISKKSFSEFFDLKSYGYSKIFNTKDKGDYIDYNEDGIKDLLIKVGHSLGLYPYGLIYLKDSKPLVYTRPGSFEYKIIKSNKEKISFTVFGNSNLVSGLKSFSEVELIDKNVRDIPNQFTDNSNNFNGYTFFLPTNLKIIDYQWNKNGWVQFINTKSGESITIDKNHSISVIKNGVSKTYLDSLSKLKNFNILFNTFYQEMILYKDYNKAEKLINELIGLNLQNPYLNSALYFFKGDIELRKGNYESGESSLKKGLKYYPLNPRIEGKMSEISFLKGYPLKSIEIQEELFSNSEHFWGLSNGTKLFKTFMYLSAGLHTKADEFTAKIIRNSKKMEFSLLPLNHLFKGKLDDAEKLIEIGLKNRMAEMTNVSFRLLCSRIYIINNSNLKRAKLFLNDILKYSIRDNHLAELSLAYLLAKDNKLKEAEKMAELSLLKVQKQSRGDFSTKFWLFYEYYIYGRIMELVNNEAKAVVGYQNCIKETPNSYLAKLSELRLSVINPKPEK